MQFRVETASRQPIYLQLVQQVREGIARGDLETGEKLPSVRKLSRELLVNPNTIARAYTELEREGVLIGRQGLGLFVAEIKSDLTKSAREKRLKESLDQWLTEAVHLGFDGDEVLKIVTQRVERFQWKDERRDK